MIRKKTNIALTVFLLAALSVMCFGSLLLYGRTYARGFFKTYTTELPENPDILDNLKARIDKLSDFVNRNIIFKDEFMELNGQVQYASGKKMISVSYGNMTRLETGELYVFRNKMDVDEAINEIISLKDELKAQDIPVIYTYCHSLLYDDTALLKGSEVFDHNYENSRAIIDTLREGGVITLDSRDAVTADGLKREDINNKTDYHWRHRAAFSTAYHLAQAINETGKINAAYENLEFDKFSVEVTDGIFLGKYGQQVGPSNVVLDKIWLITPNYDTDYTVTTETNGNVEVKSGSFKEAVIRPEKLEVNNRGYSTEANYVYGDYLSQIHYENKTAPEGTVLIFRDSFGSPVNSFLSLAVRDVYGVDVRYTDLSMTDWILKVNPDVVVFAYCQDMADRILTFAED